MVTGFVNYIIRRVIITKMKDDSIGSVAIIVNYFAIINIIKVT